MLAEPPINRFYSVPEEALPNKHRRALSVYHVSNGSNEQRVRAYRSYSLSRVLALDLREDNRGKLLYDRNRG